VLSGGKVVSSSRGCIYANEKKKRKEERKAAEAINQTSSRSFLTYDEF
jgi:hypothetical protein